MTELEDLGANLPTTSQMKLGLDLQIGGCLNTELGKCAKPAE